MADVMEQCSSALVRLAERYRLRNTGSDAPDEELSRAIQPLIRHLLIAGAAPEDTVVLMKHLAAGAGFGHHDDEGAAFAAAVAHHSIQAYFET